MFVVLAYISSLKY